MASKKYIELMATTCQTIPVTTDIEFIQGNSWSETWTVNNGTCEDGTSGTAYDFSGHTLLMTIETMSYGRDILVLEEGTGIDSSTPGSIELTITALQSEAISAGTYTSDFTVQTPAGDKKSWGIRTVKVSRGKKD